MGTGSQAGAALPPPCSTCNKLRGAGWSSSTKIPTSIWTVASHLATDSSLTFSGTCSVNHSVTQQTLRNTRMAGHVPHTTVTETS